MDLIIRELKKYPYSGNDISEMLDNKTNVIVYSDLKKFDSIDDVLYPYDCVVILYETKKNYGHWVCLIKHKDTNTIEYYDPLGLFVDDIIYDLSPSKRRELGEEYPLLTRLLYDSGYNVVYNNRKIQKSSRDVSSCGRHVGMRLVLKHLDLGEYVKVLQGSRMDPDDTVTYLTAFI